MTFRDANGSRQGSERPDNELSFNRENELEERKLANNNEHDSSSS